MFTKQIRQEDDVEGYLYVEAYMHVLVPQRKRDI